MEQIDGKIWPELAADATRLMKTVHKLRRKPIDLFSAEDLRILLGQNEVTAVLLPLVLTVLERNPLAEGDYYPGDLLTTTVRIPAEVWKAGAKAPVRLHAEIDSLLRHNDLEIYFSKDDEIWATSRI
ncbi:contact-dependent growth inhibition system immunity protein [Nocardia sp. NPDC004068]|uniref:contact-dependent growth inhibition system immunity protein n=1 Tax=Nocardia sp. NPDC004068 TaxID=3364303 RepID=UPI00367D6745